MNFLQLVISAIFPYFVTSLQSDQTCYETLEILQLRWTIENYNISAHYRSPYFPDDPNSETKWRLETSGNNHQRPNHVSFSLCLRNHTRTKELARYTLGVLSKSFNTNGVFSAPVNERENYFPRDDKHDCLMYLAFLTNSEAQDYVSSSGNIEFFASVKRLRKLPSCLKSNETDYGRGHVILKPEPDVTSIHCTGTFLENRTCDAVCPMFGFQQIIQANQKIQMLEKKIHDQNEVVRELQGFVKKMEILMETKFKN